MTEKPKRISYLPLKPQNGMVFALVIGVSGQVYLEPIAGKGIYRNVTDFQPLK